jgi:hypothetical protein
MVLSKVKPSRSSVIIVLINMTKTRTVISDDIEVTVKSDCPESSRDLLHIWASAELMHNLLKMMVIPDSA